jgi:hypothetical protein
MVIPFQNGATRMSATIFHQLSYAYSLKPSTIYLHTCIMTALEILTMVIADSI